MKNKLILCVIIAALTHAIPSSAQSTVYFFFPSLGNIESTLKLNGEELCELRGPVKKVYAPIPPHMNYESTIYSACKRKCILREEGKVLFAIDMKFLNAVNGDISNYACELQLNLVDGDVHYVNVIRHGFSDIQFEEVSGKKAEKLLKDKQYIELPDYIGD